MQRSSATIFQPIPLIKKYRHNVSKQYQVNPDEYTTNNLQHNNQFISQFTLVENNFTWYG